MCIAAVVVAKQHNTTRGAGSRGQAKRCDAGALTSGRHSAETAAETRLPLLVIQAALYLEKIAEFTLTILTY